LWSEIDAHIEVAAFFFPSSILIFSGQQASPIPPLSRKPRKAILSILLVSSSLFRDAANFSLFLVFNLAHLFLDAAVHPFPLWSFSFPFIAENPCTSDFLEK